MCIQSNKRPDAIQTALYYSTVVSGDFRPRVSDLVPVREYRERVSVISYPAL